MTTEQTELETAPANDAEEIQALRRVKESLHQTAQARKARIEALEIQVATLTTQLETANKSVHDAKFGLPLKAMANEISSVPGLFVREFLSRFDLIEQDNKLVITKSGGGAPLVDAKGDAVPFTSNALSKLLEGDAVNAEDKAMFRAILIGSKATGSGASSLNRGSATEAPAAPSKKAIDLPPSFGLR